LVSLQSTGTVHRWTLLRSCNLFTGEVQSQNMPFAAVYLCAYNCMSQYVYMPLHTHDKLQGIFSEKNWKTCLTLLNTSRPVFQKHHI